MSSKLIKNLQKIGFTEKEGKIFDVPVYLDQAEASEISRETRVPGTGVYSILRGIEKKGYIRVLEGNPIHFYHTRPEK